ncbi:hypothetical protein NtRootA1_38430 [Arthrobacter sp. NtRootA1]|nr:hypothetical protein NtRootA1_38430 [Arthrobacter sp. NtRootA1]
MDLTVTVRESIEVRVKVTFSHDTTVWTVRATPPEAIAALFLASLLPGMFTQVAGMM